MAKRRQRGQRGKPWYRKDRDQWCITRGKNKVPLRDKHGNFVRGKDNEAKALEVWHEMMAFANAPETGEENELRLVLEMYLQDLQKRGAEKTFDNYHYYYKDFLKKWPGLLVKDLKPFHVQRWFEAHPEWKSSSTRNLAATTLRTALNWAAGANGGNIIPKNPLAGMNMPRMRSRGAETIVSDQEFNYLLSLMKCEDLRDVVIVLWETGTRPVNLARATAANLDVEQGVLVFGDWNTDPNSAVHKTFKRTGRALVVPLSNVALDVCKKLAARHPTGPLFRTAKGQPWDAVNLATRIGHYTKKAGLEGRFMAYASRHTKATQMLERGELDHDVAAFLGHSSPAPLHRHYSHLGARIKRFTDMANKHSGLTDS
jgi:integrase